jgi:hypothetical protein
MKNKLLFFTIGLVLSIQTLFAQIPSFVPTNGLIGYWPFNENANDVSGNGNNGTVNGATLTTDRFGNENSAYNFNGTNNFIEVADNNLLDLTNNFTLSAWYFTNNQTQFEQTILGKGRDVGGSGYNLLFNTDNNGVSYNIQIGLNSGTLNTGAGISVNQSNSIGWHQIVGTYDGVNIKLYIDGVLQFTNTQNITLENSSQNLYFGRELLNLPRYFNGKLDDIGIWNRALTQAEITAMYNAVTYSETCNAVSGSLTQGLVGYWPFCGNANDESGNGNNGTVNGATLTSDRYGNSNSAYSFDGLNDFINMPSGSSTSLNITSNLTLTFWFKTVQGIGGGLIGFGDNLVSGNGGYLAAIGNGPFGNPIGKMTSMSGDSWYTGTTVLTDNNWHFACVVINGNTMSFIIDNVLDAQFNNVSPPSSFNGLRAIGARNNGLAGFFNGLIDDIGVWNRALTSQEITNLFNNNLSTVEVTTDSNLISIYPNPTDSKFNIELNNLTNFTGSKVSIRNMLGQEILNTSLEMNTQEIVLEGNPKGIYLVSIISDKNEILVTKKVILK